MTTQIIKQYQNVRKILDKKLRQRDEFLEKNTGGDDPADYYKMEMVKGLPAVSDLKAGNRVENSEVDPMIEDDENNSETKTKDPQASEQNDSIKKIDREFQEGLAPYSTLDTNAAPLIQQKNPERMKQ
jgi:hypothetical protein